MTNAELFEAALFALENADDVLVAGAPLGYNSAAAAHQAKVLVASRGVEYEFSRIHTGFWRFVSVRENGVRTPVRDEGCDGYGWIILDPDVIRLLNILTS